MKKGKWIFRTDHRGFSLVELIIVIAIMAVLGGILVPRLLKHIESARVQKDRAVVENIYKSLSYEYAIRGYTAQSLLDENFSPNPLTNTIGNMNYVGESIIQVNKDGTMQLKYGQTIAPGDFVYDSLANAGIDAAALARGKKLQVFHSMALKNAVATDRNGYKHIMMRVSTDEHISVWVGSGAYSHTNAKKGQHSLKSLPDPQFYFGPDLKYE
ncbi:MAG: type II secretion system protein [Lachnospiraceae bacterium]|nr:type II secretion system protein [Lachnospiraceae bacterium]